MFVSQKINPPEQNFQLEKAGSMKYVKLQLTVDIESLNAIPEARRMEKLQTLISMLKRAGKEYSLPYRIDLILPSKEDYFLNETNDTEA